MENELKLTNKTKPRKTKSKATAKTKRVLLSGVLGGDGRSTEEIKTKTFSPKQYLA